MTTAKRAGATHADQRYHLILSRLRERERVEATELAAELGVTGETLRRDLIRLERLGRLRRVHGGAVLPESLSFEPAVATRTEYAGEKTRIARAALAHLPDGGSVLLDSGSTTMRLAELFPEDRELTVFTNSLPIALELLTRPRLSVYTFGGRLRTNTLAEVGEWALRALREINVDVAFLGANAIGDRGLTTPDPSEAAVKHAMLEAGRKRILLCDHSKFGRVSTAQSAEIGELDLVITDDAIEPDYVQLLAKAGVEVERA